MITVIVAILGGLAAHQLDRIFEFMRRNGSPLIWIRLSRYGVGGLGMAWAAGLVAPAPLRRAVALHS